MNHTIVIDTPPGTSDEHIALVKNFRSDSSLMERTTSILVTTPQRASLQDVAREINFCKKTGIHITGLVENMSGFVCPNCDECSNIFNAGTLIGSSSFGTLLQTDSGLYLKKPVKEFIARDQIFSWKHEK